MRFASVMRVMGFLWMFLAVAMLLPLVFSLYYGDGDALAFIISAAITFASGVMSFVMTRTHGDLRAKEGFAVVTFGWISFTIFGSLPFILTDAIPDITNAFFETMSGFTTTGATILTNIESLPHGILLWRSLTQWIGGMGIIVLTIAILPFLGVGGMQMYRAEMPGPTADKLTPRITQTAKILWGVYVFLSGAELLLLMAGGMSFYDALNHAFTTMSTGGYSTRDASVGAFDSAFIDWVIIIFMVLAGTNFSLHYRLLRRDWGAYFKNQEFLFYMSLIAIAMTIVSVDIFFNRRATVAATFEDGLFQVVSILTTTGYGTADYEKWAFSSQFVLFMLMFFGGMAGSTAGGMKVIRIFVVVKFIYSEIARLVHPNAVVPVRIGNTVVPQDVVRNVLGFFVLYMLVFMIGVLIMTSMGLDMATSFGSVAATLNNIGPGLGSVGPVDNYNHLPAMGKWILSLLMLLGRLELFTVIALLSPYYWQK